MDYTTPGCGAHLRFHGLEPAEGLHMALRTVGHTTSTTCCYLNLSPSVIHRYQFILLGDRGTCVNNLPKVIIPTARCTGFDSRPLSCKSNALLPEYRAMSPIFYLEYTTITTTVLQLFYARSLDCIQDYPGEPLPER